jgi:hypothetical protein
MSIPFAPTFGYFGDFVSIALIIKDVVDALRDSSGSATRFQHLIQSLETLDQILGQTKQLYHVNPGHDHISDAIRTPAMGVLQKIGLRLAGFRDGIRKFTTSLGPHGSGSRLKDAGRKAQYNLEDSGIKDFQNDIKELTAQLQLLLTLAAM